MTTALEGSEGSALRPGPLFTPGKDPVTIVQEAGWAPGPVWTGAENLTPTGIRSPDRPTRSQSLYRLSYPVHYREFTDKEITSLKSSAKRTRRHVNSLTMRSEIPPLLTTGILKKRGGNKGG